MIDLSNFARVVGIDHGLSIVSTLRANGTIQSSLVNAGVLDHPLTGAPVVGFVAVGGTRKLENLRIRPRITVAVRGGWEWAAVEGEVQLIGPADPLDGIDAERLRVLLRDVFTACGGTHDDWDAYDRVMRDEGRTAVLISPDRAYGASPRG
jgi:PPOX class probable F420-dependent enzyme